MNKLFMIFFVSNFYFSTLSGWSQDTIVFSINTLQYEKVAKERMKEWLSESSLGRGSENYSESELKAFSIPAFEWNEKAKEYTCESPEKLENLLSFVENPYFQMISFIDDRSNIVGGKNVTISENRTAKRKRDSIDWISQIPNIPYSPFPTNPFPRYDLKELKTVYKYHLKHPDIFIFRIADYEGFWVIKNDRLYRLKGCLLKNANQYFYMDGEEYIRDIASGDGMRIGFPYIGCHNVKDALYWSKQGKKVFIKIIYK